MTTDDLHVRESGEAAGRPVLLLHSLFFDGRMFDGLVGELGRGLRFLAPDHRGQGRSPDGRLDLPALADDVARVIEQRCEGPVDVVGSSMGGYVATHLAARRPGLVRTCTLLGGTADAELDPGYFASLEDALRAGIDDAVIERIEHTMFGDDFLSRSPADPVRATWRARFRELTPRVADAAHAVFAREALHDAFAAVRAPVQLVAGKQDHAKPPVQMRHMADARPGTRLTVLDGVGHTPVVEAPERVAPLLLDLWAGAPAQSPAPESRNN
jgi:3-oxoadipate enol-lactonase